MKITDRLDYYRRIFPAYLTPSQSQLTFWHELPEGNDRAQPGVLGEYYMPFAEKANYSGRFDEFGIPLLNYHGKVGLQYNPIAIAQYGLGNYNMFCRTGDLERREKFLKVADWLVANLEKNQAGLPVWNHLFDWEYRTRLRAPWYSALAQGQGISVLVRAYQETDQGGYFEAAQQAFQSFLRTTDEGGVVTVDKEGHIWFEEYIVLPPTHILNGFIWSLWGVYDYSLTDDGPLARKLFHQAVETLITNLQSYDVGFWSLYEHSGTRLKMLASPFYHHLHIVQLKMLFRLTGEKIFLDYQKKWEGYRRNLTKRTLALLYKVAFKLLYY